VPYTIQRLSILDIFFLFFSVLKEIEERREFLSEMETLGKGKEYRSKIQTEISQVND